MTFRYDRKRYGSYHRWLRRKLLRTMQPWQPCARCGQPLLPPDWGSMTRQAAQAWLSRNVHLDHADGCDTEYLGLSHAACNANAARQQRAEQAQEALRERGVCPACRHETWDRYGCAQCGEQPFPPSHAFWDAVAEARRDHAR